jgi:hypothetical protein
MNDVLVDVAIVLLVMGIIIQTVSPGWPGIACIVLGAIGIALWRMRQ